MRPNFFKEPTLPFPERRGNSLSASIRMLRSQRDDRTDGRQPWIAGSGFRLHANEENGIAGTGFTDFVRLERDLFLRVTDARANMDSAVRFPGDNWLKLDAWTSGRAALLFRDFGQVDVSGRWCFAHLHSEGIDKGEWIAQVEPVVMVTLFCGPKFLQRALQEDIERLPRSLREYALGSDVQPYFEPLPLTPQMATAVTELARTEHVGRLRSIFVDAKARELFTAFAASLMHGVDCRRGTERKFRQSEIRRLHEVRRLIDERLAEPPRIDELCRLAAMNQQKLQQGFRELFGKPVYEYGQARRLEAARKMLEKHDLTVTQVAFAVGYEHPNNFSTAFKRQFGISPKAYQLKY